MKQFLLLLLITGCSCTLSAQALRIATYQYASNTRIQHLEPLATHLEKELGMPVVVKSYATVQEFITGLQQAEVDLGFINTFGYLLLAASSKPSPMKAIAAWVVPSTVSDIYKTVFIAPRTTALNWNQLKERSAELNLALVAPGSTSGNLVPRLMLNSLGFDNPDRQFGNLNYAGTHQLAVEWIKEGKANLAAMGQDAYNKAIADGIISADETHVLQRSPEIQLGPALLNQQLSANLQTKITSALLQLHQESPDAMEQIRAGWTEARHATHFELTDPAKYEAYLLSFGNREAIASILRQFAN